MKKMRFDRVVTVLFVFVILMTPIRAIAATPLTSDNFDSKRYADSYADLKNAFGYDHAKLWNHYLTFGAGEGRAAYVIGGDAGVLQNGTLTKDRFDAKRYADTYADLKKAFGYEKNLLWNHYQSFGKKEGRMAYAVGTVGPVSSTAYTQAGATTTNPNVTTTTGLAKENFDAKRYADDYADLKKAFGYDKNMLWNHYQTFGRKEGRIVYTLNNSWPSVNVQAITSSKFLSKDGGYDIAKYLAEVGAIKKFDISKPGLMVGWNPGTYQSIIEVEDINYNPLEHPEEDGGWETGCMLPAGWKATSISFTLWTRNERFEQYWDCRVWNSHLQVPPIAKEKVTSLVQAKDIINRFRP